MGTVVGERVGARVRRRIFGSAQLLTPPRERGRGPTSTSRWTPDVGLEGVRHPLLRFLPNPTFTELSFGCGQDPRVPTT